MKRLELTTDLLTGIAEIDEQHRELFIMGNRALFPDAVETSTREFADALVFLVRYVDYHFSAEEDAMEWYGYNRLKSHKKQHDRFQEDIKDVLKHAKKEGPTKHLKLKFHYMFSDWFTYHIKHMDHALAEFLQDQNSFVSLSLRGHDES
jgi:hemerythrin